jgi:hypothetical protein
MGRGVVEDFEEWGGGGGSRVGCVMRDGGEGRG